MLNKFLTITALSLALGTTSALAQAQPGPTGLPGGWDGAVGDAFFSDVDTSTLRTDDEIRASWGTMSEADRIAVQNYCASVGLGQTGAAGAAGTAVGVDDAEDQRAQTQQMDGAGAAAGQAAGVTTDQAEDQRAETEQMADDGAAAGRASGVASDQAADQHDQTEQMGDPGIHAASIERVCDIVGTM